MTGRARLAVEVALLAPATFLLLPFLWAGALGAGLAAVAGGGIDWASAMVSAWAAVGALGMVALWVVVLTDGAARFGRISRLVLAIGLLLGMVSATRWLWTSWTSGHKYDALTWAVWLVLLGGPLVIACFRLPHLLSSLRYPGAVRAA